MSSKTFVAFASLTAVGAAAFAAASFAFASCFALAFAPDFGLPRRRRHRLRCIDAQWCRQRRRNGIR